MIPRSEKSALRDALGLEPEPIPEGIYILRIYAPGEKRPLALMGVEKWEPFGADLVASEEVFQRFLGDMRDARQR